MLTLPLSEFIARLQELHARQGNHPNTKLRISSTPDKDNPEMFVDVSSGNAGGTIVATCFTSQP